MDEKEFIKKIEQLKEIKPNKEWVVLTKKEILGKEEKLFGSSFAAKGLFNWLFRPLRGPGLAFAMRALVVALVVLAGTFGYLYWQNNQINKGELSFLESHENEQLLASLQEIEQTLAGINTSLDKLALAGNQKQALTMTEVVKGTAGRGEKTVKEMKEKTPSVSKKVLASFASIEGGFRELEEESFVLQKEILKGLLEDLRGRSLAEEDKVRLERALEYYEAEQYSEAIILIQKIGS